MFSEYIRAPIENATGAESTALFTATTDTAANVVPKSWEGNFVRFTPIGGNLWYFFSSSATAEVDRAALGTAAGNSAATVGYYVPDGTVEEAIVPIAPVGGRIYFVREASATIVVNMRRAS